ncbi:hypothetical protein [Glycomyces salinus]|uniref:hypothetical protein n=1 Tax=Glycomyces salinus TaxID=980294 RepID=UPI0018EA960B|nr:hypothetical protein [Glycomyces salinus]
MIRSLRQMLKSSPRLTLAYAAITVAAATAVLLALTAPPRVYLPAMGLILCGQSALVVLLLCRRARDYDIRNARVLLPRRSVEGQWPRERREQKMASVREAADRIEQGFVSGPRELLERTVADPELAPSVREYAAQTMGSIRPPAADAAPGRTRFDVVLASNLNLPGGTTSSNANEIQLLTKAGLTVGLLHHPLYSANVSRPVNGKIAELVDGECVRFIRPRERVSCDLMIMRFPPFAMRMREDLPSIEAGEKILVINQAPMTYYDAVAGRKPTWDVTTVHENLFGWIGEHRWTAVGPLVRQALLDHHADELGSVDLADEFWYPALDLSRLSRRSSAPAGTPIRIGRHSRDHLSKWPELAADLRSCYPEDPRFEISVLGGTKAAARVLGRLPSNWRSLEFDSLAVDDFLTELDFYVYFPNSTLLEAFGRAPAEAMAAGVPTVLPPVFEPVFGDGAVYAEPEMVREVILGLADDPQSYLTQQKRGIEAAHRRFGFEAHCERLRSAGLSL